MTILTEPSAGLAWHHRMLVMPRMQGPHGATESLSADGKYIAPVVTWDSKITALLAMAGGIGSLTGEVLKRDTTYARFFSVVQSRWEQVFPVLEGEHLPFAPPPPFNGTAPPPAPDFTLCQRSNPNVLYTTVDK